MDVHTRMQNNDNNWYQKGSAKAVPEVHGDEFEVVKGEVCGGFFGG